MANAQVVVIARGACCNGLATAATCFAHLHMVGRTAALSDCPSQLLPSVSHAGCCDQDQALVSAVVAPLTTVADESG